MINPYGFIVVDASFIFKQHATHLEKGPVSRIPSHCFVCWILQHDFALLYSGIRNVQHVVAKQLVWCSRCKESAPWLVRLFYWY